MTMASKADGLLWVIFHLVLANAAEMADSTGLVSKCNLLIDLLGFRRYKEDPALIQFSNHSHQLTIWALCIPG